MTGQDRNKAQIRITCSDLNLFKEQSSGKNRVQVQAGFVDGQAGRQLQADNPKDDRPKT